MRALFPVWLPVALIGFLNASALGADKVTFVADVMPILRNNCLNCHNPDKHKAGLDMTTYQGIMEGSDSGKVIVPGNTGTSLLLKLISHTDEPSMPPKSDKLPDSQINLIRRWIEGYALETTSSQAAAIAKDSGPSLEMFAEDKASGPPPMPQDLLLETVGRTPRPGAVVSLAGNTRSPVVAIAAQKQVLLYNMVTLELAGVLPFPEGFPEVVKFSRDGRLVVAGGGVGAKSGHVVVWDVITGRRLLEAGDEFDEVLAADISPDHHFIALGGPGRMVKIFKDGKLVHSIKKHTDWVMALAFTSDGKTLISGDRQGGLCVWEVATGGEMFTLPSHKAGVTAICAPGPQACLTASEDGTVKLWDLREGKEIKSWTAHNGGTLSAAFSQDGKLVTCGRDKLVRLWDRDGNKLREFEAFGDVALAAAICHGRVVAGDWTGSVRVWDADGKRLADLTPDPPTVAERLAELNRRLLELQTRREHVAAQFAAAEKAAAKSSEDACAAALSASDKEKRVKTCQAQLASIDKAFADTSASLKKTREEFTQLQATSLTLDADLTKALAANDTAKHDQKTLEGTMQQKQEIAKQLAEAARAAQVLADKQPGDQSLADAAVKAKSAAEKAQEDLAGDQKFPASREAEVQRTKEVLSSAMDAAASNKDSLKAAQHKVEEQAAAVEKLKSDQAAAKETQARIKGEFDEISRNIPPKAAQAEAAVQKLSKAKGDLEEIDHELAVVKGDLLKWKAAQVNVSLFAARKELAERQAEEAQAVAVAHDASAELDKARAEFAAAEKALSEAPGRIKAGEQAITQARSVLDKANSDATTAKQVIAHKESLIQPAVDFASKLAAESAESSDDETLKEAAARAGESLDLLKRDLAEARQVADTRDASSKQAGENLAAVEKTLTRTKSDTDAGPAALDKLRAAADETAKRTADARAIAEKKATDAHQPVAVAQAKADALAREYETLNREAQTAYATVVGLIKK
jgi:hypothetical protein